jgi:hypothetical protein
MYITVRVTRFADKRDSAYRVAPADGGYRDIVLNTDRMSDILVDPSDATKSIFKYFDNRLDRRESWALVHANITVAEIIAAADTEFFSNMITLPLHKHKDPNQATVDHTMPVEAITYVDRYNPDPDNHCWICYYNAAFKRREELCGLSMEDIPDIAEHGHTTSTTTETTEQRQ